MSGLKLKEEFLLHNTGRESVLVPTGNAGFSGILRGNRTLGAVLELLRSDTTEAEILAALQSRFDVPQQTVRQDVETVLSELRNIGALNE